MNLSRGVILSLVIAAIAVWVFNGYIFATLFVPGNHQPRVRTDLEENRTLTALTRLADSALRSRPRISASAYKGQFDNPFRTGAEAFAPPARKAAPKAPESQVKLVLRGVLLKKQPLAILEDAEGKTYICAVHETIKGQSIERIDASSVQLLNDLGSYTLIVKE